MLYTYHITTVFTIPSKSTNVHRTHREGIRAKRRNCQALKSISSPGNCIARAEKGSS